MDIILLQNVTRRFYDLARMKKICDGSNHIVDVILEKRSDEEKAETIKVVDTIFEILTGCGKYRINSVSSGKTVWYAEEAVNLEEDPSYKDKDSFYKEFKTEEEANAAVPDETAVPAGHYWNVGSYDPDEYWEIVCTEDGTKLYDGMRYPHELRALVFLLMHEKPKCWMELEVVKKAFAADRIAPNGSKNFVW